MNVASIRCPSLKLCTAAGVLLGAFAAVLLKDAIRVTTAAEHVSVALAGVFIGTVMGWSFGRVLQLSPPFRVPATALLGGIWLIAGALALTAWPNTEEDAAQKRVRVAERAVEAHRDRLKWEVPPPNADVVAHDHGSHVVYDWPGPEREERRMRGQQEIYRLQDSAERARRELERTRQPRGGMVMTVVSVFFAGVFCAAAGFVRLLYLRLRRHTTSRGVEGKSENFFPD